MMRQISPFVILFLVFCALSPEVAGQTSSGSRNFPHSYSYGVGGGFCVSDYLHDSTGFGQVALPYGGLFYAVNLKEKLGLTASVNFFVKGVEKTSPYVRYRYAYVSGELTAHYRIIGFIQLEGGYRYGFEQYSRKLILNGNTPSGVERSEIPGFGNYGQWMVGTAVKISPKTTIAVQYGIPTQSTPLSHFVVGVRYDLFNKVEISQKREKDANKEKAHRESVYLKEGVLLVRLRTMQATMDAYRKIGRNEEADRLQAATTRENNEIIQAFSHYNFSRVFFFYDHHSALVKAGELDSILFDHRLVPIPADSIQGTIYTAELGNYSSQVKSYQAKREFQYLKENDISPDSSSAWVTYSDQGLGIGGIIIMNQAFEPLEKPFPVFTPVTNPTLFRNDLRVEQAVKKLNKALYLLYFKE
jgi:hypothetical protein